jgi:hypothetical protein
MRFQLLGLCSIECWDDCSNDDLDTIPKEAVVMLAQHLLGESKETHERHLVRIAGLLTSMRTRELPTSTFGCVVMQWNGLLGPHTARKPKRRSVPGQPVMNLNLPSID